MEITMEYYLVISTIMFFAGIYGFMTRRNMLAVLISIELILNSVDINFVAFNRFLFPDQLEGFFFTLFAIGISACETAVAIAIIINIYRNIRNIQVKNLNKLKAQETKITSAADPDSIDYEKLAEVRSEIAKVNEDLKKLSKKAFGVNVTEDDVAYVIELWTGIHSSKIKEDELAKLSKIEDKLKSKIIGQDEAVEAVASAIKRSRVQISPRRRPASFIFVGPTGVGKTELVKVLSKELFDSPETFIRLDMSEFMEKHSVSRIIGSPPGYVGYDDSGQVTEKVRRRPYSVLLFDEIEKAHPDVMNILLQILDEGRITDAQGRQVNFENTIIVMTSNAGSDKKDGAMGFAKTQNDLTKEKAEKARNASALEDFTLGSKGLNPAQMGILGKQTPTKKAGNIISGSTSAKVLNTSASRNLDLEIEDRKVVILNEQQFASTVSKVEMLLEKAKQEKNEQLRTELEKEINRNIKALTEFKQKARAVKGDK